MLKYIKILCIITIIWIGTIFGSNNIVSANEDDDVDYTYTQTGEEEKDDYNYKRISKKTISSIKSNYKYDVYQDNDDRNITHYSYISDVDMTLIYTISKKVKKGTELDLSEGYIKTSQKKYSIDLSDATWMVVTNKENVEVKDGICTVIKYPKKEVASIVRASTMKEVDGMWRRVVIYFYIVPSKNTATMDKVRTIPLPGQDKLVIKNNSAKDKSIKWETSNSKIATISKKGTITAKSQGKCTVTATLSDGYKLKCTIIVPTSLESFLLSVAEGSYSGIDYFSSPQIYYDITITQNSIGGNPYEVTKLDRESITDMSIFYVKLYDKYSGELIQEKTFSFYYSEKDNIIPTFLWWYNSSIPSWDYIILD